MITIHHLSLSQSDRIVWLCEELELSYELKRYERDPQTRLSPHEYRALTPAGTAPVITDGKLVLGESAAIVEYLTVKYGGGRLIIRKDDPCFADYLFWFHFANGSFLPAANMVMIADQLDPDGVKAVGVLRRRLDRAYHHLEARLAEAPYLAGPNFTTADIMTVFPLTTMRVFSPRDLGPYPGIRRYLQQIAQRPAFQRAKRRAEPDFQIPLT